MDRDLLSWGLRRKPGPLPRLWLFTDERRLPDPRASVARLPRGRAGVILRHDRDPARATLGRDLARICRERRLVLVVAGDVRLATELRAGVHLRGGRWPGPLRRRSLLTSSAHSIADVRRALVAGASLVFLSQAYPTASHADAPGLGPLRWAAMARGAMARGAMARGAMARGAMARGALARGAMARGAMARGGTASGASAWRADAGIAALGGVDGRTVKRLPARLIQAAGAIGALS
jgi:thiamine-phosphate pyrophosphorylase